MGPKPILQVKTQAFHLFPEGGGHVWKLWQDFNEKLSSSALNYF